MGRKGYMTMIALGRSPYEAPETTPEGRVYTPNQANNIYNDGYVQQYDSRGHPTNPASKALAKQLRRAKNDILSTMGIVVSGENRVSGGGSESQKFSLLIKESNDGMIISTVEQIVMFMSTWWRTALTSRLMAFKRYDQLSFMQMIRFERKKQGLFAFYFSGMLSWACSFVMSVCRSHLLDIPLDYVHARLLSLSQNKHFRHGLRILFSITKLSIKCAISAIIGQVYMFSLLQVLDLVPAFAIPPYQLLMPFGEKSLLRLPNLRNITSARGLGHFAIDIFQLPLSRLYCFLYLRPVLETRIYRLIRRRLPKPDRPDKLSAHVAMENEIVEWISPNLGKRSREEILRSQLSLTEDILFELVTLRRWIMELFRWRQSAKKTFLKYIHWYSQEQKTESLHRRVEQLRRDIDAELTAENGPSPSIRAPARSRPRRAVENSNLPSPALEDGELRQILTGEDQRFAQSPIQLREDHLLDIPNADRILLDDEVIDRTNNHQPHQPEPELAPRLRSRANSLFSQSSSPDLSPLASPLVRASLIHQNPDVITMQLELLQRTNSRNANNQSQGNRSSGGIESAGDARPNVEQQNIAINQASELLDMIITSHTQNHPAVAPRFHEELNTSMPTTTISTAGPETIQPIPAIVPIQPNNLAAAELQTAEHPLVAQNTQETETQGASPSQRPSTRRRTRPATGRTLEHRVTILSMHAVDSLSSHGAMILTTIILYPLETLALRSIAKSYLSSPAFRSMLPRGASTSLINVGLHGGTATYSVRSLGCWFGGGSLSNRLTYISKLLLAVGLEAIVRAAIWGVGTTVAMFIGRKKFGWGEL